ncbi:MAG: formylglycine-generating enzyme family protein [Gammaproteobacteria bacterium]|nr:formylglycine-generating enzyme family protein [Gammaproteobacteria bacterium]
MAPAVRPHGAADWRCNHEGFRVNTPPLGGRSDSFREEECTLNSIHNTKGSFYLRAREPGTLGQFRRPQVVSFTFGLDAPYGIYAFLAIDTPQGRATQHFRWIEPGTFLMGSPEDESERDANEGPQHWVTLTRGFWLADTACTQALWRAVLGDNPSHFTGDPQRPVEQVNWRQVQEFLRALEALLPGDRADLPTEAEWEYACRAGTVTPFSFGASITPEHVNFDSNHPYKGGKPEIFRGTTLPVKSLPANPWGLYEMHGNVWEWCADGQRAYTSEPVENPLGPLTGDRMPRVVRGGSWNSNATSSRSASRNQSVPVKVFLSQGFRICLRSIEPGPEPARAAGAAPKGRGGEAGGPSGGGGLDRLLHPFGKNKR